MSTPPEGWEETPLSHLWSCPELSLSLSQPKPPPLHPQGHQAGAPPGSSLGLFYTHSSILQTAEKSLNHIRRSLLCLTSFFGFPNMFQIKPEPLTVINRIKSGLAPCLSQPPGCVLPLPCVSTRSPRSPRLGHVCPVNENSPAQ